MSLPEDHEHEVGDDTTRCANCRLEALGGEMSAFELAAWNWHCENASDLAIRSGLFGRLVMDLGLDGKVLAMFTRALSMIDGTLKGIAHERARKEAEAKNGR